MLYNIIIFYLNISPNSNIISIFVETNKITIMGGIGSGGAREGAGRKTLDGEPRTKISVTLPTWLLTMIRDEADRRKLPTSQLMTELLTKGIEQ